MPMKNAVDFKKYLLLSILAILLLTGSFVLYDKYQFESYQKIYNEQIDIILYDITQKYPELDETDVFELLKEDAPPERSILAKYGIDVSTTPAIVKMQIVRRRNFLIGTCLFISSLLLVAGIYISYVHHRRKKILGIIELIERINAKDYSMDIGYSTEDELSILKTELYKTTITLKEAAENSLEDKRRLKSSLSDISHQLKTPLTSIMIALDNLEETENIDEKTRHSFLQTIQKETTKIDFFVKSLLKLSKLDTNTVTFIKTETSIEKLLTKSLENVSLLADLKDVEMEVRGKTSFPITCDFAWQVEAITNILKNAIEHSIEESSIVITIEENKIYSSLSIKNEGTIDKADLPHIFERFYRGKNASPDSVGIGLSLAKSIITKEGGSLEVESNEKNGTTFTIKYYHK